MDDLQKIKDRYGEKMMHLCRSLFPTVLETPGLLYELLSTHFDFNRELYYDIVNNNLTESFKRYIYGLIDVEQNKVETTKSPFALLKEAGYTLYECKTNKDILKFKKYYDDSEELCTFRSNRLDTCYVFFAVRDNASRLNRKDFTSPQRQDEYGTSVISIQFSRGGTNTLSIKNRYNHTVTNPDATFSNNLENIIPGLTEAFEREYGFKIMQNTSNNFEIPGYVMDNRGKYHKYNLEVNNVYYCDNNLIVDNFNVIDTYKEKERYIIADYLIIDLKEKKVFVYDSRLNKDGILYGLMGIDNIEVRKLSNSKRITIKTNGKEDKIIEIDNHNNIISYINNSTTFVGSHFLSNNRKLKYLEMRNLTQIGNNFLYLNTSAEEIILPKVYKIGNFFLRNNTELKSLSLPSLVEVTHNFLEKNTDLSKFEAPNLLVVGADFMQGNRMLEEFNCPKLRSIGSSFLYNNNKIEYLELPNLENIEIYFMRHSKALRELVAPKVRKLNLNILLDDDKLESIYMPLVQGIDLPYTSGYTGPFVFNNDDYVLFSTGWINPVFEKLIREKAYSKQL